MVADFAAQKVTASLSGKVAAVSWVSDSTVNVVSAGAGKPGTSAAVSVVWRGVPSNTLTMTYVVAITKASVSTGPAVGCTLVTLSGVGFAGSSVWSVRDLDGKVLASLAPVTSAQGLDAASSGVFVSADGAAVVKMPAAVGAGLSAVVSSLVADQSPVGRCHLGADQQGRVRVQQYRLSFSGITLPEGFWRDPGR